LNNLVDLIAACALQLPLQLSGDALVSTRKNA